MVVVVPHYFSSSWSWLVVAIYLLQFLAASSWLLSFLAVLLLKRLEQQQGWLVLVLPTNPKFNSWHLGLQTDPQRHPFFVHRYD